MPEPLPERIGKYPITRVLGEGGMGIVFLGRDPGTDRDVAVKTIKADLPDGIKDEIGVRFAREGKAGRLQHDNIVTIYETGKWDDGRPYIAMEYIDGQPLDRLMGDLTRVGKRLPLVEQLDIIRQVCEGLDYAHQNQVFHRDIKPANVMLRRDGRAKIVDFGIARVQGASRDTNLTGTMQVIGTVAYMAPERLKGGRGDGPADIFAAGVMLYYLLTGQEPFTGAEALSVAHKVVSEPYAPLNTHLPEYPLAIDQILELALAKDPRDRYSRAQEFAADLAAVINDINRERIPGLLKDAERLIGEGRWDLANERTDEVGRIDPQNAKARELSRRASKGRRDEAEEEKIRASLREAQSYFAYGRYDQAIIVLEELVGRRPGNVEFQAQLEEAKNKRRNQNQKEVKRAEALSLREMGDQTGAIHLYEELLAIDPADQTLHEEYLRLKKEFEEQAERTKTERHIENARQAVGAQRYTEAIEILEGINKSRIARPDVDKLLQEALKGRKDKDDARYREQVVMQARKLRSVEQYAEAIAEIDQGLGRLSGDTALLRLRKEIDRQANDTRLIGWIAETVERVLVKALTLPDDALIELRQAMKELPGEERFELLEADLLKRIEDSEAQQRRGVCLRDGNEALYGGDPGRAVQIVQRYLLKDRSDDEIERLLQEAQSAQNERELERRAAECEAQSQPLIDQGRFTEAIGILQPTHAETGNRRLARLLEEAERRKSEIDAVVRRLAPRILELRQGGKQAEAIQLIESQDAVTLRNPDLQKILGVLREEVKRQSALADAVSRSRQALESGEWVKSREPLDDIRRVFGEFDGLTRAIAEFADFRAQAADRVVNTATESAKAAILARDDKGANRALEASAAALKFATPEVAGEWQRLAQSRKIEPPAETVVTAQSSARFPLWVVAVVALIVIVGGIFLLEKKPEAVSTAPPPVVETSVRIKSVVGATVQIGSLPAVTTDEKGEAKVVVQPGSNLSINVTKQDFTSYSENVDIEKGEKLLVQAPLTDKRTTGNLIVKGNAAPFKVFVDGNLLGNNFISGMPIPIAQGAHSIQYEADGFERSPVGAKVEIIKGVNLKADFKLKHKADSAAINEFSANPNPVSEDGGTVTLKWKTMNARKVSLDPGGEDVTNKPFAKHDVLVDQTFTLTAVGDDGKSIKRYAEVHVSKPAPPSILSFKATPSAPTAGQTVRLTWSTTAATGVIIDHNIGSRNADGNADFLVPTGTTGPITFQLTAKGKRGDKTQTATVEVAAVLTPPPAPPSPAPPVVPKKEVVETSVPQQPAVDKDALDRAVSSFGGRITNALYTKDEKGCKAALDGLSGMVSGGLKVPLKALQGDCGEVKTAKFIPSNCSAPKADTPNRVTMMCDLTIALSFKSGGDGSNGKYLGSSFTFAKSTSGTGWAVERWDYTSH